MRIGANLRFLIFLTIGFSALNFDVTAQSSADTERMLSQLDNGKIVGNVYENKLLGLRISFPKAMAPDTKVDVAAGLKDALELVKTGKASDQRIIDEMIRKDRIVFTLDLPQTDDSVGGSMSLTIKKDETAEELKPMVERTIKFMTGNGKQKLASGPIDETMGVIKVIAFTLSMDVEGGIVFSKINCLRRNGYLLTFSIAYADEKGRSQMEAVLKSVETIASSK